MKIFCSKLVNPGEALENVVVEVSGKKIVSVVLQKGSQPTEGDIDLTGKVVIPGLIDIHIHGAAGDDFAAGVIDKAPGYLASRGTTSFLATAIHAINREDYLEGIRRLVKEYKDSKDGAKMVGIHLEGPFLNPDYGSQMKESCWPLTKENVEDVLREGAGAIKMVSLSPELAGAPEAVRRFTQEGVVTSAAHTEADLTQIQAVYDNGLRHATHILNAMQQPDGPEKGVRGVGCAEFVLASDDMTADIMVDAVKAHIPDEWLRIVFRCLGTKRVALLSDALCLAGSPPGKYPILDGREVTLTAGRDVAVIEGEGLAGSVMALIEAVGNLVCRLGIELEEAIECATLTPARILKIDDRKGSIEAGKDADLVALDESMRVLWTIVEGKKVYSAES